jgi:cell fate regulator YaaT (PSP1 superfamily)
LKKGDQVILATDLFNELGVVEAFPAEGEAGKDMVLRKATEKDLEVFAEQEKEKDNFIPICKEEVKQLQLAMKVVDARISFDSKQIIFIFTADGRVDFRELVRNLSGKFKKIIRMQQIGSRDEARKIGGYGICGRKLCCVNLAGNLPSITTEMARTQQIAHRGTERISGLCGRLMCCLAYEASQYKEILVGMPEMYSIINTKEGRGTVIEVNAISQEVKVKLESGKYVVIKKADL